MSENSSIEQFKDVTIEGRQFRIGRLPALTGNWVLTQILSGKIRDEEPFRKAQAYCLNVCWAYREPEPGKILPMKIFDAGSGRWLSPEFEFDLELVRALWDAATEFNFGSFLSKLEAKAAAAQAEAAASDTPPLLSPTT